MRRLVLPLLLLVALLLPSAAGAVQVQRVVSPGGIEAWLVEDHSLPIIALELSFKGGAASEPQGKLGLARMATSLLDEGAGPLDSEAYAAKLEDLASAVRFSAGLDHVRGSLQTLTRNRAESFDLLRLALAEPRFDAEAVDRIRADLVASVAQRRESPNALASLAWWKGAFGDHPYARPVGGTAASLAGITVDDLKGFVAQRFARDVLTIGVAGDIDPAALGPLLDRTFGGLPAKATAAAVPSVTADDAGALLLRRREVPQSVAEFGAPGIKRDDPDWYAALVVNHVLGGGGFSSRLMQEVRVRRGLAYGVSTGLVPMDESGVILGQVATQNARLAESISVIRAEWQRMQQEGPSAAELAQAKTYLTGAFALQFDATPRIAAILVQLQEDRLGIDYLDRRNVLIDGVTLDDAKRVAKRLFDPAKLSFAVVGSPTGLTPTKELPAGGE